MTLKARFSLTFIVFTAIIVSVFGGTYYVFERRDALRALRTDELKTVEKMVSVCRTLYLSGNGTVAMNYLDVLKKDQGIMSAACVGEDGRIQAHTDLDRIGKMAIMEKVVEDGKTTAYVEPVLIGQNKVSSASIQFDEIFLERQVRERLLTALRRLSIVAACTLALAVLIGLVLAWSQSAPIALLVEATRAIGAGQWDYESPISARADELGYLAREMRSMAQRLKILDELKDAFVSHVSHDLRNPMAAINMYAHNMLNEDPQNANLTPEQKKMLMTIKDNSVRLHVFVTNVLDAAKIKAGRMTYLNVPTTLAPVAERVKVLYGILAEQQRVDLTNEIPADLPKALVDADRLEQVLANLVSNSLKFTKPKGKISIGARALPGIIEVYVADTGKGMAPEDAKRLFKRFEQVDGGSQKAQGIQGTGLGLYIVKEAIEAMQGRVRVESALGQGTRFTIELPAAKPDIH
jgi:signal transduction histidine kinase